MPKIILSFVFLFIAFLIQIAIIPCFSVKMITADFLFVLVVYFSLKYGWEFGIAFGLVAGILQDSFSIGKLGVISLSIIGFLVGSFSKTVSDNLLSKLLFFPFFCVFYFFLSFLLLKLNSSAYTGFIATTFWTYLINNIILALISFFFLERIYNREI